MLKIRTHYIAHFFLFQLTLDIGDEVEHFQQPQWTSFGSCRMHGRNGVIFSLAFLQHIWLALPYFQMDLQWQLLHCQECLLLDLSHWCPFDAAV